MDRDEPLEAARRNQEMTRGCGPASITCTGHTGQQRVSLLQPLTHSWTRNSGAFQFQYSEKEFIREWV